MATIHSRHRNGFSIMKAIRDPESRRELLAALQSIHRQASEAFAAIPESDFFRRPSEGVWSPGENVIHLVKSVKAVADAMKLPKLVLRGLFGTAEGDSRTYGEVREVYTQALAGGAVATGRFVPAAPKEESKAPQSRSRALAGWQRAGASLEKAVGKWKEADLDRYRLPHPVLGKITVREMLFFTHYHDRHHLQIVRRGSA